MCEAKMYCVTEARAEHHKSSQAAVLTSHFSPCSSTHPAANSVKVPLWHVVAGFLTY